MWADNLFMNLKVTWYFFLRNEKFNILFSLFKIAITGRKNINIAPVRMFTIQIAGVEDRK